MAELSALIKDYLAGVDTLKAAVAGMTPEQLKARPIPGKWSTLEVVAHIADFDPILADRIKRIASHDKPLLMGADENKFAAVLAYQDRELSEELAIIENTRKQLARILSTMSNDVLQRQGNHTERGLLTLELFLGLAIKHIPHHVTFIQEKRKALGV